MQCILAQNVMKALTGVLDERFDLLELACRMAHGSFVESPFQPTIITRGREAMLSALGVKADDDIFAVAPRQPFLLS